MGTKAWIRLSAHGTSNIQTSLNTEIKKIEYLKNQNASAMQRFVNIRHDLINLQFTKIKTKT